MSGIVVGEIIALEDQKEFVCFKKVRDGGKDYLFLVSNFKPVEVIFAEEVLQGDMLSIRKIGDPALKQRLMQLFQETAEEKPKQEIKTLDGQVQETGISPGEGITLENKGDFICARKVRDGEKEYLCLVSQKKPRKVIFGEETVDDGILSVKIVKDPELLSRLSQKVRKNPFEVIKQICFPKKER